MIKVIKQVQNNSKKDYHKKFLVKCSCGKEYVANSQQIKNTKMCVDCARKQNLKLGRIARKKDFVIYNTRIYKIWQAIKRRCYNKKDKAYRNYGGRGINMCVEWKNNPFVFYFWALENGYKNNLTIDRIDVNGNYCPENCRWATKKQQANNTRKNHFVTYNKETKTLAEWADFLGITYSQIKYRIKKYGICDKVFYSGKYNTNGNKM